MERDTSSPILASFFGLDSPSRPPARPHVTQHIGADNGTLR